MPMDFRSRASERRVAPQLAVQDPAYSVVASLSRMSPESQLEILTANAVDVQVREELLAKLRLGRPLRVKAGFDPTSPDIHLGHTLVLQRMRLFQDLGHIGVLVVGDFTARIGDPTGKSVTRPRLTAAEVERNAETYKSQAFKVLDPARTEVRQNSEWLDKLGTTGMVELAASYSLARMLERDDFKRRFHEGRTISLHELLYPLLQAQDSVALAADVELGGTDQLFNLLVARTLMRERGLSPQIVLTTPILEGLEARLVDGALVGEKMSKSLGNYVGVTEPPGEMFGKIMSISDDLMWRYYRLLSKKEPRELVELHHDVTSGAVHPKAAKVALAKEIVTRFHSAEAASEAAAEFDRVFSQGALPDDIEEKTTGIKGPMPLVRALVDTGLCASNSEARRLIAQGGVSVDQSKVSDAQQTLAPGRHLLRVGKRRMCYLIVEPV
jgi:tyrosyl-tRNA synthetase